MNQADKGEPHGELEIGDEIEAELVDVSEAEGDQEGEDGMAAPVCLYLPKFAHKFWLHKNLTPRL